MNVDHDPNLDTLLDRGGEILGCSNPGEDEAAAFQETQPDISQALPPRRTRISVT